MQRNKRPYTLKGNVALVTVVMLSAILLTIGVILLRNTVTISFASRAFGDRAVAHVQTESCIEEALNRIDKNKTYTGTIQLSMPQGSCQVIVTTDGGNAAIKYLAITGQYQEYAYNETKKVDTSQSPFLVQPQ